MRTHTQSGIILMVVGISAFAYQGMTYTAREMVADPGPLHMMAESTRTISVPPLVGAIALFGGVVLLGSTGEKRAAKSNNRQFRGLLR